MNLAIFSQEEKQALLLAVEKCLDHGRFINGPELIEFESKIAAFHNRAFGIGVCSGTGSLYYGLRALGIGEGDEVITTSLSWIATANAIASVGAIPVFADIKEDLNLNPSSAQSLITPKTKAIMPVHYAGRVCEIDAIKQIAKAHDLLVIEDASQSIGAKRDGRLAGSFGDMACFSLNPMKVLGALGEAGVILSDDEAIKERVEMLRYNGTINKETCIQVSLNGRMDTLQAAILLYRLEHLSTIIQKRKIIAYTYHKELGGALSGIVRCPIEARGEENSWYSYTILAPRRDELQAFLAARGIETKIQHPILMPNQPAYLHLKKRDELSNANKIVKQILCIPAHEKLTQNEQEYVIQSIKDFYAK